MLKISRRGGLVTALLVISTGACGKAESRPTDAPEETLMQPSAPEASIPASRPVATPDEPEPESAPPAPATGPCGEGAGSVLTLRSQAAIDDLAGCDRVQGSLSIAFSDATLDLRPLAALRVVEGQLLIVPGLDRLGNSLPVRLRSLNGLEGLESVESLVISGVESGLSPLSQLSGDVADLILDNISGVRDLSTLAHLRVTRQLSLNALPDLETVGGVGVARQLETVSIGATPKLTGLSGLAGLEALNSLDLRDVGLSELALPDSLVVLPNVSISGATELTTPAELSRFPEVLRLRVADSPRLTDLGGTGAGDGTLQSLQVSSCPALIQIDPVGGFSVLQEVDIYDCDGITEIDRIGESTAIQTLHIRKNDALTRLPVFDRGPAQMVQITVSDNPALQRGPSFPNLTQLYFFEALYYESAELEFTNNPLLSSIGDYPKLESITMLALNQQPALTDFELPSLHSLQWLRLRDNPNLARVELAIDQGLSFLEVSGNPQLEALKLGAAPGVLSRLQLQQNPALASEDRQRLLDRVDGLTETTLD